MSRGQSHLAVLYVLACVATSTAHADTLVLPVDGPGLLPSVRDSVEMTVRGALTGLSDVTVQARDTTAVILADAAAGGLACSIDSVPCAARLGAIADVDSVLLPSVKNLGTSMSVTIVDVRDPTRTRVAMGPIALPSADRGASVTALVKRAMKPGASLDLNVQPAGAEIVVDGLSYGVAPLPGAIALEAGDHSLTVRNAGARAVTKALSLVKGSTTKLHVMLTADNADSADSAANADASGKSAISAVSEPTTTTTTGDTRGPPGSAERAPPVVAIAVTAAGAVIAGVGAVGVTLVELDLGTPKRGEDPQDDVNASLDVGRGMLVATGVGLVVAAIGGALFAVGGEP